MFKEQWEFLKNSSKNYEQVNDFNSLQNDLSHLCMKKNDYDLVIFSKEMKPFFVHKAICCARWYFLN